LGILDEAIREHLELKRQHGAGQSELDKLEDEAFGPPARPGEAPAEPGFEEAAEQLIPPAVPAQAVPAPPSGEAPPAEPEPVELESPEAEPVEPGFEEHPAIEHPIQAGPPQPEVSAAETEEHPPPAPPEEPSTAEAEASTELHDFEGEYEDESAGDLAVEEPPAAPAEPVEDEFFSEQSLSDELDQALDAPAESEAFEVETVEPEPGELESPEAEPGELELQPAEEDLDLDELEDDEGGDDVLEETPEFLQDTPEHDRLWFEQKPPKDFDFDD